MAQSNLTQDLLSIISAGAGIAQEKYAADERIQAAEINSMTSSIAKNVNDSNLNGVGVNASGYWSGASATLSDSVSKNIKILENKYPEGSDGYERAKSAIAGMENTRDSYSANWLTKDYKFRKSEYIDGKKAQFDSNGGMMSQTELSDVINNKFNDEKDKKDLIISHAKSTAKKISNESALNNSEIINEVISGSKNINESFNDMLAVGENPVYKISTRTKDGVDKNGIKYKKGDNYVEAPEYVTEDSKGIILNEFEKFKSDISKSINSMESRNTNMISTLTALERNQSTNLSDGRAMDIDRQNEMIQIARELDSVDNLSTKDSAKLSTLKVKIAKNDLVLTKAQNAVHNKNIDLTAKENVNATTKLIATREFDALFNGLSNMNDEEKNEALSSLLRLSDATYATEGFTKTMSIINNSGDTAKFSSVNELNNSLLLAEYKISKGNVSPTDLMSNPKFINSVKTARGKYLATMQKDIDGGMEVDTAEKNYLERVQAYMTSYKNSPDLVTHKKLMHLMNTKDNIISKALEDRFTLSDGTVSPVNRPSVMKSISNFIVNQKLDDGEMVDQEKINKLVETITNSTESTPFGLFGDDSEVSIFPIDSKSGKQYNVPQVEYMHNIIKANMANEWNKGVEINSGEYHTIVEYSADGKFVIKASFGDKERYYNVSDIMSNSVNTGALIDKSVSELIEINK